MFKITYKRNGIESTRKFDSRNDLIIFVAMNLIKDEELVSVTLAGEEITGGIQGLALYAIKQAMAMPGEDCHEGEVDAEYECCEDCKCIDDNDQEECIKAKAKVARILANSIHFFGDKIRIRTWNIVDGFKELVFDRDEKVTIVRCGAIKDLEDVESDLSYYTLINVKASKLEDGDIIVFNDDETCATQELNCATLKVFKVGDRVRIIIDKTEPRGCSHGWADDMDQYVGKIATIRCVEDDDTYYIDLDNGGWCWGRGNFVRV